MESLKDPQIRADFEEFAHCLYENGLSFRNHLYGTAVEQALDGFEPSEPVEKPENKEQIPRIEKLLWMIVFIGPSWFVFHLFRGLVRLAKALAALYSNRLWSSSEAIDWTSWSNNPFAVLEEDEEFYDDWVVSFFNDWQGTSTVGSVRIVPPAQLQAGDQPSVLYLPGSSDKDEWMEV